MATADRIDVAELAREIKARLQSLLERRAAPVRVIRREYSQRLQEAPAEVVIQLAKELIRAQHERGVAYDLIHYHRPALHSLDAALLEELGEGIDSWWSVDGFARNLAGPAWREGLVADEVIHRWAASQDRWWRRAALVSTVAFNVRSHGGYGDAARTLAVCRLLVEDRDDMVVKGMSWALRELVAHDPEAVRAFLTEYEGRLAARVKREVNNKLTTGLKNPKRK